MNNQNLSDRDVDILIALGAAEYVKQVEIRYLDEDVEVSSQFQQTMVNLIKKHKGKEKYQAKRKAAGLIAACVTIAFSIGLMSSISVNAFGIKDFIINVYERYFTIGHVGRSQSSPDINSPIKMMYSNLYLPTWLPEGTEYEGLYKGDNFFVIQYKYNQDMIRFTQIGTVSSMKVDNEVKDYQVINKSGKTYYILLKYLEDKQNVRLMWMQDQHQLIIESSLGQDAILKIAENIEFFEIN